MTELIQKKLSDSKAARWTALAIVAFTMLCGYFLTDVMSPLKPMLEAELQWSSTDFGFFTSAYGWFNVFFLMLIFGGMILDKMGVRFTGLSSCLLMVVGCAIKYAAVAGLIGTEGEILGWSAQVIYASLGYALFGVGVEIAGIAIVLYLNQTPYQPRERDYAYAGSFYAFCIWIGFGVAALAKGLQQYGKLPAVAAASVATLLSLFVPIQMGAQNWDDHDRSGRYVCRDFGSNYLESCEPNAVIFTNGDNDTFPLWYAQEVEGIRTDVRVCNTSYLQTDWYIDQMKKQAYDSDPLPISWTRADYVQGTRDAAYVFPMTDQAIDLGTALDFVRSNDPKFKKIPGYNQQLDYIPSQTITYQVDSAAVMAAGVISPADTAALLKQMTINLKDKDYLGKQELIILDMLRTNNWQRPIYYAITVSPDQFVKLDPYFQQTGLAYQLVPMEVKGKARSVNTEKMYDNIMNKFKWGGVDKPGIYLDENVMRMCKSYRAYVFGRLAASLIAEGQKEKALNVLDKAMQVLPPENVPLDYSALSLAEMYYELGQQEKAEAVYTGIADAAMRNVNWFFRLSPQQFTSVLGELEHNLAVVQEVLRVSKRYHPEFGQKYQEEFDNYRMAYNALQGKE